MIHVFHPPPETSLTGGYIYNTRMCEQLSGARTHAVIPGLLPAALAEHAQPGAHLLVDSLYIGCDGVPEAMARHRASALVHHLPSCDPGYPDARRASQQADERAYLRAAAQAIVTSHFMAALLRSRDEACQVIVAVPGVDDAFFDVEPRSAPGRPEVVTIANMEPRKGLLEHIDAVARAVRTVDFIWVVIGAATDAGYSKQVRAAAAAAGLRDHITWCGQLEREALCERLARASVHLVTTRFETYGMAAAESLAAGVPVVAPALGELPRLIREEQTGLLASPGDADALLAQLVRALTEPGLGRRLRAGCLDLRNMLPRWPEAAARLSDALDAVS